MNAECSLVWTCNNTTHLKCIASNTCICTRRYRAPDKHPTSFFNVLNKCARKAATFGWANQQWLLVLPFQRKVTRGIDRPCCPWWQGCFKGELVKRWMCQQTVAICDISGFRFLCLNLYFIINYVFKTLLSLLAF